MSTPLRLRPAWPATTTPLPAARPSAFTTMGVRPAAQVGLRGVRIREAPVAAVGMSNSAHRSFVKALGALRAGRAARRGPKALMPAAARSSTIPATSGPRGRPPTRSRFAPWRRDRRSRCDPTRRGRRSSRIAPGLDCLARYTRRSHKGLPEMAQARACSRPPESDQKDVHNPQALGARHRARNRRAWFKGPEEYIPGMAAEKVPHQCAGVVGLRPCRRAEAHPRDAFGHVRLRGEISGYRGPHSSATPISASRTRTRASMR